MLIMVGPPTRSFNINPHKSCSVTLKLGERAELLHIFETFMCSAGKSTLTDSLVAAAGIIAMENVRSHTTLDASVPVVLQSQAEDNSQGACIGKAIHYIAAS